MSPSGAVRVGLSSNIEDVIDSVDDVKDDLRYEMRKRVGKAMLVLWADARQYVLDDPNHTGQLFKAIQNDESVSNEMLTFSVYADLGMAPYAAITEFGSGQRSNKPYPKGNNLPGSWTKGSGAKALGYPFESPDIDYNTDNPFDMEDFPDFYGFVQYIKEWMATKPVAPERGNEHAAATFIARAIIEKGNYAHPYLRPAWFDNELKVKQAARNAVRSATR